MARLKTEVGVQGMLDCSAPSSRQWFMQGDVPADMICGAGKRSVKDTQPFLEKNPMYFIPQWTTWLVFACCVECMQTPPCKAREDHLQLAHVLFKPQVLCPVPPNKKWAAMWNLLCTKLSKHPQCWIASSFSWYTFSEGFVQNPPNLSLCCYAFACEANMVATLWDFCLEYYM